MVAKKRYKALKINTELTAENKCGFCKGSKCCVYLTQEIDTPRSRDDFDHLLWQLAHENIQAYKDEDGWFLLINNRCTYLLPKGGCKIYATRPQVCRDYTNDFCEYDEPAEFEKFFDGYDALLKYCKKRFKSWEKRFPKA